MLDERYIFRIPLGELNEFCYLNFVSMHGNV